MYSVPKVIASITSLYLLNFVICHALDVSEDFTVTSVDFPVESETEGSVLPDFNTAKRIYEKIKYSSDNTINYEEKVFGAKSDNDDNYKLFHEYNVNKNNVCLLDNLKRNLLWWAHLNGSLVANGEKFIINRL